MYWLQRYDPDGSAGAVPIVRGPRRVNVVSAAVREYSRHSAGLGEVDEKVLNVLFDVEDYELPRDIRGGPQLHLRTKPRHRLSEPERVVDAATDEEVLALLRAYRNAHDRFIVLALWRISNRRGELTGARLENVHFVPDASRLGCRHQADRSVLRPVHAGAHCLPALAHL